MFENEDFDLDETWFTNDLQKEVNHSKSVMRENAGKSTNVSNFNSHTEENAFKISKNISPKKVVLKRKFPGPAGLFPEREPKSDITTNSDDQNFVLSTQALCSQNINITFQEITWLDMRRDFINRNYLLDKYNIEWIKNNVKYDLINKKVPFLAGIIKQVKNTSKSPIYVLADPTGEMEALISSELYEDFAEYLNIDSVLILKQFSILSVSKCKHYVNITIDNLIRIYSCQDSPEDVVKIVHIQKISNENLERDINDFVQKYERFQNQEVSIQHADFNFDKNINKADNFELHKFDDNVSCNSRNLDYLMLFQNLDNRSINVEEKSVLNGENDNFWREEQNFRISTETKSNILNNKADKTVPEKAQKKFNFKNVLLKSKESESRKVLEHPSASGIPRNSSIFDQSSNSLDLDLSMDDFQGNFMISEGKDTSNGGDENKNGEGLNSKKRKLDLFKCKLVTEEKVKVDNSSSKKGLDDFILKEREDNLPDGDAQNRNNVIDCSQISILTQNNENPDIIKEVFSGLDAAALFDDF